VPSDDRKRELKRKAKEAMRAANEAEWYTRMVLSPEQLKLLLDHLDKELGKQGCDHTLRLTTAWGEQHGIEIKSLTDSMHHFGGGCDCEVLANVDPETRVQAETWPAYMERYG
jgi:Protein of unknown function (DUF2695)